ncbi:MAG: tryptophan--tRNA ligase [Rhodospirillales bacterium]|nr:tryptophan--tRNA ligase [Rhodospirillales bacterium]
MARVFSGVQPTGNLHLGNYLGAIRNFVPLQDSYDSLYCVVDMHAVTVWQDPAQMKTLTREVTAAYLAAGIDPKKAIVFNQSQVAAHAELAWIFNCVARLGWLNRMTQFKDKAGKNREKASAGLYVYPNLMAADILLYKATHVPVGEDQKQHLELAHDIAQKFNHDYAVEIFPQIEPLVLGSATRVMSLRDGKKKMSKSDPSDMSRIVMTDGPDEIAKKIRKATTDPNALPGVEVLTEKGEVPDETRAERPECWNLLGIYAALAERALSDVVAERAGQQFSAFKKALTELAVEQLGPVGTEMKRLMNDPGYIDSVLADGAARARALAGPVLAEVYDAVGFLRS